jgi:hypothetical protein
MPIIPNATNYTIDSDNRLYRDGKRLRVRRSANGVFGRVECDDGVRRRLNFASVVGSPETQLTHEYVFERENARLHEEFPDYAVTNYGDVYCLRKSKSGVHANSYYIVPDFLHGPTNKRYISIRRADGRRYQIRLARFVRYVWGDGANFNEEE